MNQEQLLDHVAGLIKQEAQKGKGTIMLLFKEDFFVLRLFEELDPDAVVIHIFNSISFLEGLAPSVWLKIAKLVWACKCPAPNTIKFPVPPSAGAGKPRRKPKLNDEPPKVS